jgi:hypothetical protein
VDERLCACHGVPMFRNGRRRGKDTFICRVKKNERERARYRRDMETPEGKSKRNAKARRQYQRRKDDPAYLLQKQLWEMTRIRVI